MKKNLNDWETEEIVSLVGCLSEIRPNPSKGDTWENSHNKKERFTVKSLYSGLKKFNRCSFPSQWNLDFGDPFKGESF